MPRSQFRGRLVPAEKFEEEQEAEREARLAAFTQGVEDRAPIPTSSQYMRDEDRRWADQRDYR